MKKIFFAIAFFTVLGLSAFNTAQAQVVVRVKPLRPNVVVVKHNPVRAGHIYVDGHWRYSQSRKRYIWVNPRYVRAKAGHRYVAGRWVVVRGGYKWVPGRWVRA